jgi:hypothetical protein
MFAQRFSGTMVLWSQGVRPMSIGDMFILLLLLLSLLSRSRTAELLQSRVNNDGASKYSKMLICRGLLA